MVDNALRCSEHVHFRFEEKVLDGVTYAFSYRHGHLVVGKRSMFELLSVLKGGQMTLENLTDRVCSNAGIKRTALLQDIVKLLNAGVIMKVANDQPDDHP
jgi:hypothetical protein